MAHVAARAAARETRSAVPCLPGKQRRPPTAGSKVAGSFEPRAASHEIARVPVAVPPHDEQREIVRRVTATLGNVDRLVANISSANAALDGAVRGLSPRPFVASSCRPMRTR